MKKTVPFFCILIIGILFGSCKKTDLTATYIYIDTTAFYIDMTNFNEEFATGYDQAELECIASQKFHDAWVYVDGKDRGTWELPCKIPIFSKDSANVQIFPGVKMNGVSTSRPRYPFTDGCTRKMHLEAGKIIPVTNIPVKYYSTIKLNLLENFEKDYNSWFHSETADGVNFEHIRDPQNPANKIGVISLKDSIEDFNVISENLHFDFVPSYVFLELDYKCDVEGAQIYVGMLIDKTTTTVTSDEPLVVLNADPKWKKIYVNLTQSVLRNQTNVSAYRVYFSGGRSDETPMNFSFDNIKVIYR